MLINDLKFPVKHCMFQYVTMGIYIVTNATELDRDVFVLCPREKIWLKLLRWIPRVPFSSRILSSNHSSYR